MFDKKIIDVNLNFINFIEISKQNGNLCNIETYDVIVDEENGVKPRADEFRKGDYSFFPKSKYTNKESLKIYYNLIINNKDIRNFKNNFWSKFHIGK